MNKGLYLRDAKRLKRYRKTREVKDDQIGVCRFVKVRRLTYERKNGKIKAGPFVNEIGLQVENKIHYVNGKYSFVNAKGTRIDKVYKQIPDSIPLDSHLRTMYEIMHNNVCTESDTTDK